MTEDEIDRVELLERSVAAQERIAIALETIAGKMPAPAWAFPAIPLQGIATAPNAFTGNFITMCHLCSTPYNAADGHSCATGPET